MHKNKNAHKIEAILCAS